MKGRPGDLTKTLFLSLRLSQPLHFAWVRELYVCFREFNTAVDIKLTDWGNVALPKKSVEVSESYIWLQISK